MNLNKELANYIRYFIIQLNNKKSLVDDDETKRIIVLTIKAMKDSLKDCSDSSDYSIIKYGEYLQKIAFEEYNITLLPFEQMEWKPLYRNIIITSILL